MKSLTVQLPDLLKGRVRAKAAMLGMKPGEFVTEVLEEATADVVEFQQKCLVKWNARYVQQALDGIEKACEAEEELP